MKYLSRLLCIAILLWAIFSFSSRPQPKPHQPLTPPPASTQEEKISLKSSAPAKPKKQGRVRELAQWIEEDRLCDGKGNFLRPHDSSEAAMLYQALERSRGNLRPDPCLTALLAKDKKQILLHAGKSEHESCQLLRALVLTGQMGLAEKSPPREIAEGEMLLRQLASAHPGNGVYPFFLLGSTKDQNQLRDFLRATEFRNPLARLAPRLWEIGLQNATAFLFSAEALANMKVPDYQAALAAAREGVTAPALKDDYQAWLKSHLADMEDIKRLQLGEPFVWPIEIAVLHTVASSGWRSHGEGAKPPLLEQKSWKGLFRVLTNMDAFAPFHVNEEQPCERFQEAATGLLPDFATQTEAMARRWAQYR